MVFVKHVVMNVINNQRNIKNYSYAKLHSDHYFFYLLNLKTNKYYAVPKYKYIFFPY